MGKRHLANRQVEVQVGLCVMPTKVPESGSYRSGGRYLPGKPTAIQYKKPPGLRIGLSFQLTASISPVYS